MRGSKRDWLFRVQVFGVEKSESVFVVGNLPALGSWSHYQAVQLHQEHAGAGDPSTAVVFEGNSSKLDCPVDGDSSPLFRDYDHDNTDDELNNENEANKAGRIFSSKISLPTDVDVEFRYFIATVCEETTNSGVGGNTNASGAGAKGHSSSRHLIIRRWETHMTPRIVKKNAPSNVVESMPDPDKFGYYNGYHRVDRGWLTDETVIQFKICNNPIKLWKNRLQNKKICIKMTPVNLVRHNSVEPQQFGGDYVDDSMSMDTQDVVDQPAFSITEVAVLNDENPRLKLQEQFGRVYSEDDCMIFNVAVQQPETIAYLVDYYVYNSRTYPGEPPNHIGFSYILPSTLQTSVGHLTVPITSTKHRPIGQLTVEFVVVKSIPDQVWDMSASYAKHWEHRWSGLDVGHRGLGNSFSFEMKNCANVRENTVASLKTAAYHGADMVEFDVQLSKDLVPVVYHDFFVSISLKRKKDIESMDMLEIPVKDLTLEQLHLLKVYHVAEARDKNQRFFDEDLEDHQPFPTLQTVLQSLETHVAFNIEIKWTMQLKDGTYELNHPFDLNLYLDTILKVVLEHGGERKIVFSSFHPDICMMIRLKQNKYPVFFLTLGITAKYPAYSDVRCQTISMAMKHALFADILGINVHTEDLLRDPSQVKMVTESGLIMFCWGDDNNDKETIQRLKKLGLHAVIYDKIDEYNAKEVKESIFLVHARESQKTLIALAQQSSAAAAASTVINQPTSIATAMDYSSNVENNKEVTPTSTLTNSDNETKGARNDQQDNDIGDLTKDFSVCAKSFGHPVRPKNWTADSNEAFTSRPAEIIMDDESAKDGLL